MSATSFLHGRSDALHTSYVLSLPPKGKALHSAPYHERSPADFESKTLIPGNVNFHCPAVLSNLYAPYDSYPTFGPAVASDGGATPAPVPVPAPSSSPTAPAQVSTPAAPVPTYTASSPIRLTINEANKKPLRSHRIHPPKMRRSRCTKAKVFYDLINPSDEDAKSDGTHYPSYWVGISQRRDLQRKRRADETALNTSHFVLGRGSSSHHPW
ncbi:uncharacterized protein EV422DRAFT_357584 [Fimicolochytrium jonesii]|uniref:uncharacterized protein n=1 Tax=Fimicolochytrium jonesii TaxID=1396493 RepID=UPI0022FED553|nr:uncharacterized protein EV422DRAFT_357584 [Fimicolochytrium jonesii]KAI8823493.1 hypothetical protein EV422DRAFT_357584 [Fimicolochytrium jonesii]